MVPRALDRCRLCDALELQRQTHLLFRYIIPRHYLLIDFSPTDGTG